MSDVDRLRAVVAGLGDRLPHGELERFRASRPPVTPATVERLVTLAQRGGPHPGLDEVVESWRRGATTWSVLRTHPRMIAAQQERAAELLAAVRRERSAQ